MSGRGRCEGGGRLNEQAAEFYAELREQGRNRNYWGELAELGCRKREGASAKKGRAGLITMSIASPLGCPAAIERVYTLLT